MLSVELARLADAETNGKLVRAMDASTDDGGSFMVGLIQQRFVVVWICVWRQCRDHVDRGNGTREPARFPRDDNFSR